MTKKTNLYTLFWYLIDLLYDEGALRESGIRDCQECVDRINDSAIKSRCQVILDRTIRTNVFHKNDRHYINNLLPKV